MCLERMLTETKIAFKMIFNAAAFEWVSASLRS
jgi:hypothetical protein